MKELLKIYIHIIETNRVESASGTVQMILFDGRCEGEYFHGKVLPGGVDTQKYINDQTPTLSARYIMEGQDCKGNPCRIFVENNAVSGTEDGVTEPCIYTDSEELRWMEKAQLSGRLVVIGDEPVITIYAK